MRFVFAIVTFIIAAVLVVAGIAQRTVLLPPDQETLSATATGASSVVVVDGDAVNAREGIPTVKFTGGETIVAAYGRTTDVLAWIGDTQYTEIGFDSDKGTLTSKVVPGTEKTVPTIEGSDLWIDEFKGASTVGARVSAPSDISFIAISDGTEPAPSGVSVSWPVDNSTPWFAPLMIAGAVALLLGLAFLLWALQHMRSSRGPRRKQQKMPRVPRQPRFSPGRKGLAKRGMIALPILLVGAVVLSACSTEAPSVGPSPTPSALATPSAPVEPPAATVSQVQRIVTDVRTVSVKADADRDATLLATRFEGPALEYRTANYAITKADPTIAVAPAIPDGDVRVTLPQRTDTWPRTVFAIVQSKNDETIAPVALFLEQADARSDYKVSYMMSLEASVVLPDVAPADVGASRLTEDSPVLRVTPDAIAEGYADILEKDTASASFPLFDAANDTLRPSVGVDAKAKQRAELATTASLAFGHALGTAEPIVLATNNAGALVAVNLNETTTVAPVETGASITNTGAVKALSGLAVSTKGVVATYSDQLLFYVPATNNNDKIKLLGFTAGLVKVVEIG